MTIKLRNYLLVLVLLVAGAACKTKDDFDAFKAAEYSLKGIDEVRVNGINLLEKKRAEDFSFSEAAVLFSAFSENKLNATTTLNLNVELGEDNKDRTMTVTQLKWQMLVNNEKALSGVIQEAIQLKNGLNTIKVSSPLAVAQESGGTSLNSLLRMATLLNQEKGKAQVQLQIKPTIETSVGPVELPAFINIK
ncbi:hypothetical protein [uncultured Pontibacter sp.]|uniref:hypothetical protein n=1 Tax=uncultured Pontibacter sp. TaxID=453356 RepID=UPI00260E3D06|nr:hypothetical protein [uncultured Pontibacter sp.]